MNIYDSAQARRSAILHTLQESSSVNVTELSEKFGVSEVTIRKDLRILKDRKLLVRIHGGAIKDVRTENDEQQEHDLSIKRMTHIREKEAIGRAAAKHIEEGDTILVDSGSTALEVVKNLHRFNDLTIITNSVTATLEAIKYNRFKVILLGGTVRGNSRSVVGPLTESNLKVFYCDKLFLGVDSFSVESGLSTPSVEEASTNQVMISQAREVIAVFDSSKVNKRSLAFIAGADKINTLISDDKLSIQVKSQLVALGVKVETVTP